MATFGRLFEDLRTTELRKICNDWATEFQFLYFPTRFTKGYPIKHKMCFVYKNIAFNVVNEASIFFAAKKEHK